MSRAHAVEAERAERLTPEQLHLLGRIEAELERSLVGGPGEAGEQRLPIRVRLTSAMKRHLERRHPEKGGPPPGSTPLGTVRICSC